MIKTYLMQLKKNGKGIGSYIDMIYCTLRYGASPNNYNDFGFEKLNADERKTYVTNGLSRKMIKRFNDSAYIDLFEDKTKFAERFEKYFGRGWISTKNLTFDTFRKFLEGKEKFIYKPIENAQGQGIIVYDDLRNPKKIFEDIMKRNEHSILEEWIEQHPVLSEVYGDAINCLRIITVYNGEHVFLAGGVTWGNGKKIANASASGIVSPVDFETGVLRKPAADFTGNIYEKHPITGVNVVGLQLPFWQETIDMLKNAMEEVPEVAYIGWDVAITPKGPIIIEGNTTPGYRYYQIPVHMTDGKGNRVLYEQCLK